MRVYYVIHDQSSIRQTEAQRDAMLAGWQAQPFARVVAGRPTGPNEQFTVVKRSLTGEYLLGGIDLTDSGVLQTLDVEAAKIDGRFKQIQRQLELVALAELRAALPPSDATRAGQLSVEAVAWGERDAAITGVQDYLQANALAWYA